MEPAASSPAAVGNLPPAPTSHLYETATDELAMIAAARNGDSAAFAQLLDRHSPRLYHLLFRLCGNAELASELLQEVVIHVWQRLDRFAGHSRFATWLWSVGRNRALDILRKRQAQQLTPEQFQGLASRDGGPDHRLIAEERQQLLHQALAQLAIPEREIIMLRDFQDWDYQQIAEALAVPLGTVKSRLARARGRLRELLQPFLDGGDI